jgi:hypothetical protein
MEPIRLRGYEVFRFGARRRRPSNPMGCVNNSQTAEPGRLVQPSMVDFGTVR